MKNIITGAEINQHVFEPDPKVPMKCKWCDLHEHSNIHVDPMNISTGDERLHLDTPIHGEHVTTETGAKRSNKYPPGTKFPARYDLMMRNGTGLRRLAEVYGEGFAKYGADNCYMGFTESVYFSHAIEHLRLHSIGDTSDDHIAHAVWNLMHAMWTQDNKPELSDLTKIPQKV